jgi:hypothetical protein
VLKFRTDPEILESLHESDRSTTNG